MYMIIKHTHLTIIALTFILFLINFILTVRGSDKVNNKLLKIGPHILYTLFVLTFIYLMIQIELYPFINGWASSKLAGFVFYVLSIAFALKWAKKNIWRYVGLISAVFWLVMTSRLGFADRLKVKGSAEQASSDLISYLDSYISIFNSTIHYIF